MPQVMVSRAIDAPVEQVWNSWDDFGSIDVFNPNLSKSFLLPGSRQTGLGATRQCDLKDGKNYIQERIIEYVPQRRIVVDIFNGTIPLKKAVAEIDIEAAGFDRSKVTFTMTFEPKFGLIGRLMAPMMKRQFRRLLGKLMDGNKAFVEAQPKLKAAA